MDWKRQKSATITNADDAEYCCITGYYYVKYYRDYDKCFLVDPDAQAWEPILAGLRKEYKAKVQPLAESGKYPQLKELAEKFWYHLTNSANSEGRWPASQAKTCPFITRKLGVG